MTESNAARVAQIAAQMRARREDAFDLDAYTVVRIEVATDPDHPIASDAERLAEIRAVLAARALVLAELRAAQ
jgi:hypothetical protein